MVGVWIAPVIAQVMMTLSAEAIVVSPDGSSNANVARRATLMNRQRHQAPVTPPLTPCKLFRGQCGAALAFDFGKHRPGPIDASLHLRKQVRIDALVALDIVAYPCRSVEVNRLKGPHE